MSEEVSGAAASTAGQRIPSYRGGMREPGSALNRRGGDPPSTRRGNSMYACGVFCGYLRITIHKVPTNNTNNTNNNKIK